MKIHVPPVSAAVALWRSPLFWQAVFVATGVGQSITMQLLRYLGASDSLALTPMLFIFMGTVCVRLIPKSFDVSPKAAVAGSSDSVPMRFVAMCACFEFFGNLFSTIGLGLTGSGIHIVVYSSMTLWTALLNKVFMKRSVSNGQLLGIGVVFCGLCLNVFGASHSSSGLDDQSSFLVLVGIASTLLGTISFSANYVLGEAYMKNADTPPNPRLLSWHLGRLCLLITATLWAVVVLPRASTELQQPWSLWHWTAALTTGLSLSFVSGTHTFSWYMSLGSSGAVSTGLNQAIRAVVVFGMSSLLFCRFQQSQCFSSIKAISGSIVLAGVLLYSRATAALTHIGSSSGSSTKQAPERSLVPAIELNNKDAEKMLATYAYARHSHVL